FDRITKGLKVVFHNCRQRLHQHTAADLACAFDREGRQGTERCNLVFAMETGIVRMVHDEDDAPFFGEGVTRDDGWLVFILAPARINDQPALLESRNTDAGASAASKQESIVGGIGIKAV